MAEKEIGVNGDDLHEGAVTLDATLSEIRAEEVTS